MFDRIFGGDDDEEDDSESVKDAFNDQRTGLPSRSGERDPDTPPERETDPDRPGQEQPRTTSDSETEQADDEPELPVPISGGHPVKVTPGTDDVPESENEYAVEFSDKRDMRMGRELKVWDTDGDEYAGDWVRKMFEGAADNPTQAIWTGYQDSAQTGVREVPVSFESLFRHLAIFGTTGYGKTALLVNIMTQLAYGGHGFCFIDPKGDGVIDVVKRLPEDRTDDVIWIDPDPDSSDKVVGINFLEASSNLGDRELSGEVESIVDDLIAIVKDESYWGPLMNGVLSNFARGMIQSARPYNFIDMYYALLREDYRQAFAEDVDDPAVRRYTQKIAEEMDESDLDSLIRRLQRWVENKVAREIIAHKESSVNIKDAVESRKIILVKNDLDSKDVKRMVSTGIMRRIWAAVKARDKLDEDEEFTPFFLLIDEFDDVVSEDQDVEKMLSKARSMRLSVTLCSQNPSQLAKSVRTQIFGNCDTLLAMNPNEPGDAGHIMKRFGDFKREDLLNLGRFKMFTRISINAQQSDPFITNTFAPYPPLRTNDEAWDVIEQSLDKYGVPRMDTFEILEQSVIGELVGEAGQTPGAGGVGEPGAAPGVGNATATAGGDVSGGPPMDGDAAVSATDDDDGELGGEVTEDDILESIFALQLQTGEGFIPIDDVRDELEYRVDDIGYQSITANMIESLPDTLAKVQRRDGEAVVKLTEEGRSKVFEQDTGSSASGGGDDHRYVLRRSFKTFTKAGFKVHLPTQEGQDEADGVALVPMDMSADSYHEAKKKMDQLEETYPAVAEISDGRHVNIEAETTTIDKPKQTIKNLRKALELERKCIFTTKDMSSKNYFEYHANVAANIMLNPPLVSEQKDNGARRFYNDSKFLELDDGVTAIRRAGTADSIQWWETGDGRVELRSREGDVIASFDDLEDAANPSRFDVPAYYEYDRGSNEYIVTVNQADGEQKTITYSDSEAFEKDWSKIYPPLIPEIRLPRMPEDDDWMVVIFPDDDNDEYDVPMWYKVDGLEDGEVQAELVPLLPEDRDGESRDSARTSGTDTETETPDGEGAGEGEGDVGTDTDESASESAAARPADGADNEESGGETPDETTATTETDVRDANSESDDEVNLKSESTDQSDGDDDETDEGGSDGGSLFGV